MSSAVALAAEGVVPYEYVPSADDLGISARRWNPILQRRLDREIAHNAPDVLVFDGTYPYRAVAEVKRRHPRLRTVWSRRPMWKPGMGARQLGLSGAFDLVIEPGELAADLDRGLTASRDDALKVRPVTLMDRQDVLGRAEARSALGMDPEAPAALLTMGAGAWQDVDSDLGSLVNGLRVGVPEAQLHLVRPSIARSSAELGEGIRALSVYPLSRYLEAFDLVVTAAGYNTFHETVALSRPGAFVGVEAQLDDQPQRARWAEREGVGLDLRPRETASVARAAALLASPRRAAMVSERCQALWPGNGAADAMAAVEAVADGAEVGDLLATSVVP
ncbi:hypothetical protein [Pseudokineococcus sp. 1T1Z-3]|uniref:hypothetical protein n=1 Tax=Pseudokineococcus sp. 1T1Z-3 TaxID=3132745 RepID=UPI0030ABC57E